MNGRNDNHTAHPAGLRREKARGDMLYGSHLEEKHNRVEQILVWSREYTREQLNSLNLPKIREIYNSLEFKIISKVR